MIINSSAKPNYIVISQGKYRILHLSEKELVLMKMIESPDHIDKFYFEVHSYEYQGPYGVYGTSMENITVEPIK